MTTMTAEATRIGCETPLEGCPVEKLREITLVSEDGATFVVPRIVAEESTTIKSVLEDVADTIGAIPLPAATARWLGIALEFCNQLVRHRATPDGTTDFSRRCDSKVVPWQKEFIAQYEKTQEVLIHLLVVSNYLHIQQLIDLCAYTIAMALHSRTVPEMRAYLHITDSGFTPEQEAEVMKENEWLKSASDP